MSGGEKITIRPHPQGGFTLAVPVPGTVAARVYVGRYAERRQAAIALADAQPMMKRAIALAAQLAEAVP